MGFCSTWPSGASSLLVHESGLAETPSGFAESIGRCDQGTQSTGVNEIPPDLTGELAALQEHCSACDALEEKVPLGLHLKTHEESMPAEGKPSLSCLTVYTGNQLFQSQQYKYSLSCCCCCCCPHVF